MENKKYLIFGGVVIVIITFSGVWYAGKYKKIEVPVVEHVSETSKVVEIDIGTIKNMSPEMNTAFYGRE